LLTPEEPQEEVPQENEQTPEAPIQVPAPPQEEPEPEEDPKMMKRRKPMEESNPRLHHLMQLLRMCHHLQWVGL
jgi:hypothetical protein